jgi:hypothetical protein
VSGRKIPLKAAGAPARCPVARACTNMSTHAAQTQAGTHRHVGLAARACTNTCTPSQTQARTQHKPPFCRLPGRLQLLSSASLGGSLFVPGHVRNRGATPWSWTALCSKKNKVATPLGTDPMERQLSVIQTGANDAADQTRCTLRV